MFVRARVTPGAKRERVVRVADDTFDISVREPALQNLANTRVRELVAHALGVVPGAVRIIAGHRSGTKVMSIDG